MFVADACVGKAAAMAVPAHVWLKRAKYSSPCLLAGAWQGAVLLPVGKVHADERVKMAPHLTQV